MLGDGIENFGVALVRRFEELKIIGEDRRFEMQSLDHLGHLDLVPHISLLVAERPYLCPRDHAADAANEIHVPAPPAKLAVGDRL
jgi:hypothetical protein